MSYSKKTFNKDLTLVSIRLPADVVSKLMDLSRENNMTFSQYVRMILQSSICR